MSKTPYPNPDHLPAALGAVLLAGRVQPNGKDTQPAQLYCSKATEHTDAAQLATQLLLTRLPGGPIDCRPRCDQHPAADDARLIALAYPDATCYVVMLAGGDEQCPDGNATSDHTSPPGE